VRGEDEEGRRRREGGRERHRVRREIGSGRHRDGETHREREEMEKSIVEQRDRK